jgi:hypothetical protein
MKPPSPVVRLALWATAGLALTLVALAYLNPHLAFDLAARVWACF